jgi:septum formation protein
MKKIVLASTSIYRKQQLATLGLAFEALKPLFDEEKEKTTVLPPIELAQKLAYLKAKSLAKVGQITIGGDQLVSFQGTILGKAGSKELAVQQLLAMQGNTHELITALTIFDGVENFHNILNTTKLKMKSLTQAQIEKYVELDNPIDCAGSYKIEKHGIQLMAAIETTDFTAIQGIPLLELSEVLSKLNIAIP